MKQNIEFYPHYASSDQHAKFKMLRVGFGWAGEGKFWALNNRIAIAEKCCLDISKKYNKASLANDLEFSLDEFDEFIDFLKDDCELIKECEKGVITTDIIQEAFGKVMHERDKARARHRRTSGEKTKTSGEEIYKVKESKVKESKKEKKEPFKPGSIEYRLANYLLKFILSHNPNCKKPNLQLWAKDIELMLRIDKRPEKEIELIIKWSQQSDFWYKNILSTGNLRKKYDTLFLQMQNRQEVNNERFDFG